LCWNVRGINNSDKWDAIRYKIEESNASIFCLQETKKKNLLTSDSLESLPQKDLTNLITALLWELLEVS
jgi:exonuclease III